MNKSLRALGCILLIAVLTLGAGIPVLAEQPEKEASRLLRIETREDFLEFAENCRLDSFSRNLVAELETDLDLSGTEFAGIPIFCGIFNGNHHTVSGFVLTDDGSAQGFIRYLTAGAQVRNLQVLGNIHPQGTRSSVGGIAGSSEGTVSGCTFRGELSGGDRIGGIAGTNAVTGIIENCQISGSVHGSHFVGGIAGKNEGLIRECLNSAQINVTESQNAVDLADISLQTLSGTESANTVTDVGGIAGVSTGVIRNCRNRGDIGYRHMGYNMGGIAGSQQGYLTGCVNHGKIQGRKEVGGIVGQIEPLSQIAFTADTLQILQQQMAATSALTDRAAQTVKNQASSVGTHLNALTEEAETAQKAMGQLMPDPEHPDQIPDPDQIQAAQNALNASLQKMQGTAEDLSDTARAGGQMLAGDISAINSQMRAINHTIHHAAENLGGSVTDISDEDTPDNLSDKVENCSNYGPVLGDLNVGGIVGAMAWENDMDPEDDLKITGEHSMNFESKVRAVVLKCKNYGDITAKKWNAGGITGWLSIGLVRECTGISTVNGDSGKYVGGIAGSSSGYIRSCSAKGRLTGSMYVGGIAGSATVATDCRSMVTILNGDEKLGAVLGYRGFASAETENPFRNNFYMVSDRDFGGIDGISYDGIAQSLPTEEFLALPDLDHTFGRVSVIFRYADGREKSIPITPGSALDPQDIPPVPEKEGCNGIWGGLAEADISRIFFDLCFEPEYTAFQRTVRSRQGRENELPLLLAQGYFPDMDYFDLEPLDQLPETDRHRTAVESWKLPAFPEQETTQLRYALPEDCDPERAELLLRQEDGTWVQTDFTVIKNYLVFSADSGADGFCLTVGPEKMHWSVGIGIAVITVCVCWVVLASLWRHLAPAIRKKQNHNGERE